MSQIFTNTTANGSPYASSTTATATPPRRSHRKQSSSQQQQHRSKSNQKNGLLLDSASSESGIPFILQFANKILQDGPSQQHLHDVSPSFPEDHWHNNATPCSVIIRAAALDILPENHHHQQQQLLRPTSLELSSTPAKTPITTTTTTTTATLAPTTLLGQLVKHFLLNQHRQQQQQQRLQQRQATTTTTTTTTHTAATNHDNEANGDDVAAVAAKRKKKRKKKKKSTTTTSTTTSLSGDDDNRSLPEENDEMNDSIAEQHQPVVDDTTVETNDNNNWTPSNASLQPHQTTMAGTTTTETTTTTSAVPTGLNHVLVDSCLDSILASQSHISSAPPSNRTLESFLTFLSNRISQYQASSSSMERGNFQKKKNGDDNDTATTTSSTTTTTTSTTMAKRKKTTHASSVTDPSFAVSIETLFHCCDSIQCGKCRQSVQRMMKSLMQELRQQQDQFDMEGHHLTNGEDYTTQRSATTTLPCWLIHADTVEVSAVEQVRPSPLAIPVTGVSSYHNGDHHNGDYDDDDDDWDLERAFDYVALEEGTNAQHESEIPHIALEEVAMLSDKLVLRIEQNAKMLVLGNAAAGIGNQQMMETFFRSVVLACGLEAQLYHDDNPSNTFPLSDDQFQFIRDRVQKHTKRIAGQLDEIGMQLSFVESQLEGLCRGLKASNDEEESNCEFKTAPELRKCDKKCMEITSTMLQFLRTLTREYNAVLLKTQETKSLDDVLENLWKAFFEAIRGMMSAADEYHSQLENFAGRDLIPQMFISAEHRRIFRQMLENKVRHLSACYRSLFIYLQGTKEAENNSKNLAGFSFLRCMYTLDTFCSITGNRGCYDDNQTQLDELWGNATQQLIACASVINLGYVTDIEVEHRILRERLDEVQLSFFQTVQSQYHHIIEKHCLPDRYIQRWQDLVSQYVNLQRERKVETETFASQTNLQHQGLFQGITRVMFRLWSQTNAIICHVQRSNHEPQPNMPEELKRWMSDAQDGRPTMIHLGSDESCSGGGGQRRLTCILAGLIYRWLAVRCEEWNSELAEAELLTSVESAVLVNGNEQPTTSIKAVKSGKKNRRRRERKSADPESSQSLNLIVEPFDEENFIDHQPNGLANALSLQPVSALASAVLQPVSTLTNAVPLPGSPFPVDSISLNPDIEELQDNIELHNSLDNEANESNSGCFVNIGCSNLRSAEPASQLYVEGYEETPSIFIVDADHWESAEDFLVGRLTKLLNGQDTYVKL